ncbi:MAG: class IV adenylate cyclase [Aureliella sp.]
MQTQWEVEQKYEVDDLPALRDRLAISGFTSIGSETNSDVYFRHPCRNLKATDEAFRLRSLNDSSCVTYKGKRLAGPVKSRPEIELSVSHVDRESWLAMFTQLGFTPLPAVVKRRESFVKSAEESRQDVGAHSSTLHVMLDEVEQLGSFAEIELIVSAESELQQAAQRIEQVAKQLGLRNVQPRSYNSMLLAKLKIE